MKKVILYYFINGLISGFDSLFEPRPALLMKLLRYFRWQSKSLRKKYLFAFFFPVVLLGQIAAAGGCSQGRGSSGEDHTAHRTPLKEYTQNNAREWSIYLPTHLPHAAEGNQRNTVLLYVSPADEDGLHEEDMGALPVRFGPSHYIEKIGLMDEKGKVLGVTNFGRNHRGAYSVEMELPPGNRKKLKIFARCNLHDLWSAPLEL